MASTPSTFPRLVMTRQPVVALLSPWRRRRNWAGAAASEVVQRRRRKKYRTERPTRILFMRFPLPVDRTLRQTCPKADATLRASDLGSLDGLNNTATRYQTRSKKETVADTPISIRAPFRAVRQVTKDGFARKSGEGQKAERLEG